MFGRRKKPKKGEKDDPYFLAREAELEKIKVVGREKNDNRYLSKEAELKELAIVKKEVATRSIRGRELLLKSPEDKLSEIRKNTSDLTHKIVYFNTEIVQKSDRLEATREHAKIQNILKNVVKKEKELNKRSDDS